MFGLTYLVIKILNLFVFKSLAWKISSNWSFQRNVGFNLERAQTSEHCSILLNYSILLLYCNTILYLSIALIYFNTIMTWYIVLLCCNNMLHCVAIAVLYCNTQIPYIAPPVWALGEEVDGIFTDLFWVFKESALRPILSSSRDVRLSVCLFVCPLPMWFFSRPLIGPQVTWSDPGLSLPKPVGLLEENVHHLQFPDEKSKAKPVCLLEEHVHHLQFLDEKM